MLNRRQLTTALVGAAAAATFAWQPANADMKADLAAEAANGPAVTWYESSKEDQAEAIIAAFNKTYPDIEVQHIRVVGGNKVAGRVVQEIQGQGYTADLVTAGSSQIWQLNERGHLMSTDWQALGVPTQLTPSDFTVAIAASVYVILVNTDKVPASEEPKSWADLMDPKWAGRMGSWVRAGAFAQVAHVWGKDKAQAKLEKFVTLKPYLFKSTFPMAQQVGAGEVDVAIGFFHTAQPPIDAGAPLKRIALDPAPMHTIYTSVTEAARNPAGAKLFLAWLASPEGAMAYENATNRGSHLLKGTRTYDLVSKIQSSEFPAAETAAYREIATSFNEILGSAGAPR